MFGFFISIFLPTLEYAAIPTGGYLPSLDFSDSRNSQYVTILGF